MSAPERAVRLPAIAAVAAVAGLGLLTWRALRAALVPTVWRRTA